MGRKIVETHIVTPKLKTINPKSKKCPLKKSENIEEKGIAGWGTSLDRLWTTKNRKPNIERETRGKKLRFT